MLDKLMKMASNSKEGQPFPKTDFGLESDLPTQLVHLKRKVAELEDLINTLDNKDKDNKMVLAHAMTKVMFSGYTMLNIVEKNFTYFAEEVIMEYLEKGYFSISCPEEQKEIVLDMWKAKKKMEAFEKKKREEMGVPDEETIHQIIEEIQEEIQNEFDGENPEEFQALVQEKLKKAGISQFVKCETHIIGRKRTKKKEEKKGELRFFRGKNENDKEIH